MVREPGNRDIPGGEPSARQKRMYLQYEGFAPEVHALGSDGPRASYELGINGMFPAGSRSQLAQPSDPNAERPG